MTDYYHQQYTRLRNSKVALFLDNTLPFASHDLGESFLRYFAGEIVAVVDRTDAESSLSALTLAYRRVPIVPNIDTAIKLGATALVLGTTPADNCLPTGWMDVIRQALQAGISIVNGLQVPLAAYALLPRFKLLPSQWVWDVHQMPFSLTARTETAVGNRVIRVVTVGSERGVGSMSVAIELDAEARRRNIHSKFIATGAAGLLVGGVGASIDTMRVDLATAAIEQLVLQYATDNEFLFIEGQGSLLNPGTGAELPILSGARPNYLVLVHRPGRSMPSLREIISLCEQTVYAVNSRHRTRVCAIALNTAHLEPAQAVRFIHATEDEAGLPCTDAVRFGAERIFDALCPFEAVIGFIPH